MNREIITKLKQLNDEFMPRYLGTSHEPEEVQPMSSFVIGLDTNNTTKYGLDYYDLMIANILLSRHREVKCSLSANMAELITRMGYEGLMRLGIFTHTQAVEFCNALAIHHVPRRELMWKYLIWVERFDEVVLPYWFYYTLLMFAFTNTKHYKNKPYRSRVYIGCIHAFGLTKFSDYNADHKHDVFNVRDKFNRVIISCLRDEEYSKTMDMGYIVDSIRVLATIMFAALLNRSCTWDEFRQIGREVLTQRLEEHQKVVDNHYTTLVNYKEKSRD